MDDMPHTWKTCDDEHCSLMVEDVSFGGTLASLEDDISPLFHLNVAFGGLGRHPLTLDIILEARIQWMMWFWRWFDRLRLMACDVCT
jgi:hypothetical protein